MVGIIIWRIVGVITIVPITVMIPAPAPIAVTVVVTPIGVIPPIPASVVGIVVIIGISVIARIIATPMIRIAVVVLNGYRICVFPRCVIIRLLFVQCIGVVIVISVNIRKDIIFANGLDLFQFMGEIILVEILLVHHNNLIVYFRHSGIDSVL
jgi:hypothetical protein